MSLAVFEEHRAHVAALDSQALLGSICWWEVTATRVPHSTVKTILEGVGLDDVIPRPPADSDVFRRTFENGARRQYDTDDPNVKENLLVRPVSEKPDRMVKRIVQELVDASGETLAYEQMIDIHFSKEHPDRVEIIELNDHARAYNLAVEMRHNYLAERGCLNAEGVRNLIRRGLDKCRATAVREHGGVYFIGQDHALELAALEAMAENVPGCKVHSLPLIDDRKQRDMVRDAFKSEAGTELDKMLVEIDKALAAGDVSDRKYLSFKKRVDAMKAKAQEYSRILEDEVSIEDLRQHLLTNRMRKLYAQSLNSEV